MKLLNIFLLISAVVIRFAGLGIYPAGGANAFWLRLPSAVAGVVSIILLVMLVKKLTRDTKLSYVSGWVLNLMPWHIEQSRIYSQAIVAAAWLLLAWLIIVYVNNNFIKLLTLAVAIISFKTIYPTYWIFSRLILPRHPEYLWHLFQLVSFKFLFFKNDSFWQGGLRNTGVFLPGFLPVFLLGGLVILKNIYRINYWLVGAAVIWLSAAANPLFPEGREFFLITPYLAVIGAFGAKNLLEHLLNSNKLKKLVIVMYLIFMTYEYVWFIHIYVNHYSTRIANEVSYEKRDL